jgi:hypothetical protein
MNFCDGACKPASTLYRSLRAISPSSSGGKARLAILLHAVLCLHPILPLIYSSLPIALLVAATTSTRGAIPFSAKNLPLFHLLQSLAALFYYNIIIITCLPLAVMYAMSKKLPQNGRRGRLHPAPPTP